LKKYILLLLCCLLIPCSAEAKDLTINLKYTPREKVKVNPKNIPAERIYFEEVDDTRSRPTEIGENREDKGKPVKILSSKEDGVAEFTLSILKKEFRDKGFKVEDKAGDASKILSISLLKFWTLEESNYNTEIQLRVEVKEKRGEYYFKKTYSSKGTNRGRSLSEVNYNECISDALARLTDDLFSDSEFLRGLAEKPRPSRAEEKRSEALKAEEKRLETIRAEEKRLEELKAETRRLEDKKAEEKKSESLKSEEKRLEELRAETKRLEEKRAEEKKLEEKRLEELKAEAKRLEDLKEEVKRLEEVKAEEKRTKEKQEEERKIEELKAEVKKLEELKAVKEEILAEEKLAEEKRAEEKKREEEKRAKEKRATPAKTKPAAPTAPVFGPK
jgi:hypothetical protein